MDSSWAVIVLAAGRGSRFQGARHKLDQPLSHASVLGTTLRHAIASGLSVVVVTTAAFAEQARGSVAARDVVVLPAGTGHKNLGDSGGLLVVGAYPDSSAPPDMLRGTPEERLRAENTIAATPDPARDPVTGRPYPARG